MLSHVKWISLESDDEYFDAEDGDTQPGKSKKGSELKKAAEAPNEELINLLLKFEIKEVCVLVLQVSKYILVTTIFVNYLMLDPNFKYIKNIVLLSSLLPSIHTYRHISVPRKWNFIL